MDIERKSSTGHEDIVQLQCLCASLRRAARAVTHLYREGMKNTGLAPTQYTLLKALAYAGEISQGTLGSVLALDSTTLTRTVARLQEKGWVETEIDSDRRKRRLRLTTKGLDRLNRAERSWEEAQERLHSLLGKKEWNRLHDSLHRLTLAVLRQ